MPCCGPYNYKASPLTPRACAFSVSRYNIAVYLMVSHCGIQKHTYVPAHTHTYVPAHTLAYTQHRVHGTTKELGGGGRENPSSSCLALSLDGSWAHISLATDVPSSLSSLPLLSFLPSPFACPVPQENKLMEEHSSDSLGYPRGIKDVYNARSRPESKGALPFCMANTFFRATLSHTMRPVLLSENSY